MAVKLIIRDGSPHWWLSPDIWVVPGNDPTGSPGAPIAGQPAYLWAHVANSGSSDANGARVDFFWANPALQVLRSTATAIGSAFADIPAGGSQDVLCLVPWIPVIVNDGHECVVAVVNHPGNPLPTPLPDDFAPPSYDQVAQINLSVVSAFSAVIFMTLAVAASRRRDKASRISLEVGGKVADETLRRLGIGKLRPAHPNAVKSGLHRKPGRDGADRDDGAPELDMKIGGGTQSSVYLSLKNDGLKQGEYQLVSVIESSGELMLGGYSFIVVPGNEGGYK